MRPSFLLPLHDAGRSAIRQRLEQSDDHREGGAPTNEKGLSGVEVTKIGGPVERARRLAAAWMAQARRRVTEGDIDAARRYAGAAIAARPSAPEPHTLLGILYAARGDDGEARSCFGRALTVAPDAEDARIHLHQLEAGVRPILAPDGGVSYRSLGGEASPNAGDAPGSRRDTDAVRIQTARRG